MPLHALPGDPFDALGDPNRRAILELLAAGDRSVGELAGELPISRPAVSRHLRLLKDAGLVIEEPRGTQRIYRLHDYGVAVVREYLEQVWGEAATRLRMFAENTGERASGTEPGTQDADAEARTRGTGTTGRGDDADREGTAG
jgi:DNA-binding transcriptional ArsR family regulator